LLSHASRSGRTCGPRWWAVVLLLVATLPFASVRTGATGTITTATTVAALIADINAANASPTQGPYTINLTSGGLYTLVAEAALNSGTGLPAIVSGVDLTIVGNGATIQRSTATGTPDFRIFSVNNGATLRLNTLAVWNGSFVGAAGASGTAGTAFPGIAGESAPGGAILNSGALFVSGSAFANNHAVGGAGGNGGSGPNNDGLPGGTGGAGGVAGGASGGAINNLGRLIVTGSTFSNNAALGGVGGNGGNGGNGTGSPGGIGGNAGKGGDASGGALNNGGMMTVTNSTFVGNIATGGVGGNGGKAGIGSSGNSTGGNGARGGTGQGGGILTTINGTLTVSNGTLTGNGAIGGANGTGANGPGAPANSSGGGIHTPGGNVTVQNTILAANTAISDGNCGNFVTDGGYNLEFSPATTCGFMNHAQSSNPILGALMNHGGPTQTVALGFGSVAINHGNPTVCTGTAGSVDQRGLPRSAGQCSIGAFEPQASPTLTAMSPTSGPIAGGSSVTLIGAGFLPGATVLFDINPAAAVMVVNTTKITVTTPAHNTGTVGLVVTNPDLQATSPLPYTYGTVAMAPGARLTGVSIAGSPGPLPGAKRPSGASSGSGSPSPLPPHR